MVTDEDKLARILDPKFVPATGSLYLDDEIFVCNLAREALVSRQRIAELEAVLAAAPSEREEGWRSIRSAPFAFICSDEPGMGIAYYENDDEKPVFFIWRDASGKPMLWHALPPPPASADGAAK